MLLWMDPLLRRIVEATDDCNVLAAHDCLPDDVVYDVIVADNSMIEMHIRRMHLTT